MDYGREKAVHERPVFHTLEPQLLLSYALFGPEQDISLPAGSPTCTYATDLDGDGDADVLSASVGDNNIAWYENLGLRANGDANGDGLVDDNDLSLLLVHWGRDVTDGRNGGWDKGEFRGSAPVNDDDLSLLLANWTGAGGAELAAGSQMLLPAVQDTKKSYSEPISAPAAAESGALLAFDTPELPAAERSLGAPDDAGDVDVRSSSLRLLAMRAGPAEAGTSRAVLEEELVDLLPGPQVRLPL